MKFICHAIAILAFSSAVTGAIAQEPDGEQLFNNAEPACAVCHTLEAAGSAGAIGPNLDELAPTKEQIVAAVTSGVGVMPAYEGSLSEAEIEAVADYVSQSVGTAEN